MLLGLWIIELKGYLLCVMSKFKLSHYHNEQIQRILGNSTPKYKKATENICVQFFVYDLVTL